MKILLAGYPGSQVIVPISKWLTNKYLPEFDIRYLNYTGGIRGWSDYIANELRQIDDENIIFALDDYLVSDPIDVKGFAAAMMWTKMPDTVCVKLCESTPEEHSEYPVTTQYCIWNREYLIELLGKVNTPWEFEISGSKLFDKKTEHVPCIKYFTNSSISGRWNGIRLDRLNEQDVDYIKKHFLNEKKTVIFGGSGFLGNALIDRLISMGRTNILAVARNEGELTKLKERYPVVATMSGDVADPWVVRKAMHNAEEVYLLSAMKHVGLAENEVKSCVNTNVIGTMNIINESIITKPKVLLFVSTDKASQPRGVYGCSKKIGERLMAEAEKMNPDTKYRTVRYGNVFGSTGSFIIKWKPKMLKGEEIIITDPEATRFFWTVAEAVDLIFECINSGTDATPFIPRIKAVTMGNVLEACMQVFGKCPVKTIGLQEGENKHETMDGITFSNQVSQFTVEEFKQKFLYDKSTDNSSINNHRERISEIGVGASDVRFL